jgi:hypothetical protein
VPDLQRDRIYAPHRATQGAAAGRSGYLAAPPGSRSGTTRTDAARGAGPDPTFGFGEPPVGEGIWKCPATE